MILFFPWKAASSHCSSSLGGSWQDSVPQRGGKVFSARYKFHTKINPPASLCCSLHQRRLHDGDAAANPRPEPRGDPGPLQRWAADARDHGGLYDCAQKDLQICVRRRPRKVRGVDGRVWVCVKRIYSGAKALKEMLEALKIRLSEALNKGTYQSVHKLISGGRITDSRRTSTVLLRICPRCLFYHTQSTLGLLIDLTNTKLWRKTLLEDQGMF